MKEEKKEPKVEIKKEHHDFKKEDKHLEKELHSALEDNKKLTASLKEANDRVLRLSAEIQNLGVKMSENDSGKSIDEVAQNISTGNDTTANILEGIRKPYCVASSDGRKEETIKPTGFTGAPHPLLICESVERSQSRVKL